MSTIGEWWTTPAEANRRLEQLGKQMAQLTAAALGRGVTPIVSPALAAEVGETQGEYLAWRQSLGGFELVTAWKGELELWERRAELLRLKIVKEGKAAPAQLEDLPPRPGDDTVRVLEATLWKGAAGLVALGAGLVLAVLWGGRR
jgi:hypothetical protein